MNLIFTLLKREERKERQRRKVEYPLALENQPEEKKKKFRVRYLLLRMYCHYLISFASQDSWNRSGNPWLSLSFGSISILVIHHLYSSHPSWPHISFLVGFPRNQCQGKGAWFKSCQNDRHNKLIPPHLLPSPNDLAIGLPSERTLLLLQYQAIFLMSVFLLLHYW